VARALEQIPGIGPFIASLVIAFYRWRHALHVQESLPQLEKVRERTSGGAWSEHRPLASD
jgi:hypothetical protein